MIDLKNSNDKKKIVITSDLVISLVLLFGGIWLIYYATQIPVIARRFVIVTACLLIIISVLLIISNIKKTLRGEGIDKKIYKWSQMQYSLALWFITLGYIVLINLISFFPATAIIVPAMMFFLGVRSWKIILFSTIGINLFVYLLFVVQLRIPMP